MNKYEEPNRREILQKIADLEIEESLGNYVQEYANIPDHLKRDQVYIKVQKIFHSNRIQQTPLAPQIPKSPTLEEVIREKHLIDYVAKYNSLPAYPDGEERGR